jgi:hypothetical protein
MERLPDGHLQPCEKEEAAQVRASPPLGGYTDRGI